ncbi:MAG: cell division protein ZapA [Saprospiraceae bacterium]|jgi:cell division protein ZapA
MSQNSSVKVLIAEREYPLTVSESELEQVKNAESEIKKRLKSLRASYQVKEKQDLLAMCLLQMVVEKNQNSSSSDENEDIYSKIEDLESFVSDYLKK